MNVNSIKKLSLILGSAVLLQGCVAAAVVGGAAATKVVTDPRTVGTWMMPHWMHAYLPH